MIEKQNWILGNSTGVQFHDEKWTAVNSVKVQAEKLVLTYPRIGTGMDSILRYETFGIASGVYSSMKIYCTHCKAKGEDRLTLLIRGDRAVASWRTLMSMSIP